MALPENLWIINKAFTEERRTLFDAQCRDFFLPAVGKENHETQVSVTAQALFSGQRVAKRELKLSNLLLVSLGSQRLYCL